MEVPKGPNQSTYNLSGASIMTNTSLALNLKTTTPQKGQNPAAVYLASLAPTGRRGVPDPRHIISLVSVLTSPGCPVVYIDYI